MKELLNRFSPGQYPPVVYLHGPENYFKSEFIKILRRMYSDWEYQSFDYSVSTDEEILAWIDQYSLTGRRKLTYLYNVDKDKRKKDSFFSYLQDPIKENVVVFAADENHSGEFYELLKSHVNFACEKFKDYNDDAAKWLTERAGKKGFILPTDLARLIITNNGHNLFQLSNELTKITLVAKDKVLSKEDVVSVLSRTIVNQVYELTAAFGNKDLKKALRIVSNFYTADDDPSMKILVSLQNHVERLLYILDLKSQRLSSEQIAGQLSMHPYRFKKAWETQLSNFSVTFCLHQLIILSELDSVLRTSFPSKKAAIETFFIQALT